MIVILIKVRVENFSPFALIQYTMTEIISNFFLPIKEIGSFFETLAPSNHKKEY